MPEWTALADNITRYRHHPTVGHYESYFWRANDPQSRRAIWLKTTILARPNDPAPTVDVWCCTFDGNSGAMWGHRESVPLEQARLEGTPLFIEIEGCSFNLDPEQGTSSGALSNERGACTWNLSWTPVDGLLGAPMSIFPFRWMLHTALPKAKTVTPHPALAFSGTMDWSGETISADGWYGMQGHNWGTEHTPRYAWGQCIFVEQGVPVCMVEGFSGQVEIGGRLTPAISALEVRYGARVYRFNHLLNLWNQKADIRYPTWSLELKGAGGVARIEMRANPKEMVCLGYANPDGKLLYCLNSKLAEVSLKVIPKDGLPFEFSSPFGGALEFLSPENPGFKHVI